MRETLKFAQDFKEIFSEEVYNLLKKKKTLQISKADRTVNVIPEMGNNLKDFTYCYVKESMTGEVVIFKDRLSLSFPFEWLNMEYKHLRYILSTNLHWGNIPSKLED